MNISRLRQMVYCYSHTTVAQASALLDISVIIYSIFERSEWIEEGCSSKMREHWERKARQVLESPSERSGEGKRGYHCGRLPSRQPTDLLLQHVQCLVIYIYIYI
jgi:hypothetical protein